MRISEAESATFPSALAARMLEIRGQSQRYQGQLARLQDELEELEARIKGLGSDSRREVQTGEDRQESVA
jgi:cell division protein FtsB